jgi:hypothetical protein
MSKPDAQTWTYSELNRLYPPLEPERTTGLEYQLESAEGGNVSGLSDLPESWPKLPPNATLAVEVQWVLANRLQCVDETGDRVRVDLSKALSPAPSYAALGWMETSIRAFAKFVDISAKTASGTQDDQEKVKRERMSIEEVRGLLAEMRSDPPAK